MRQDSKNNKKNLIFGAVGAFFMMLGDLSLSLIAPCSDDKGLFLRQAYMDGAYPAWKLVFLFLTGVAGIIGYWFGLKAMRDSVDEKYKKTKTLMKISSALFCISGPAIHFGIGVGAYVTSFIAVHNGADAAIAFAEEYSSSVIPGFYVLYLPIAAIFITHFVVTVTGKTENSRKMTLFAPIIWMGVFALIPDIRQALGCELFTIDYVITQCSGNLAPLLWFLFCLVLPDKFKRNKDIQII